MENIKSGSTPLSFILWNMIWAINKHDHIILPVKEAGYITNINTSIGNNKPILCKVLQHDFWFMEIYEPWRSRTTQPPLRIRR